MARASPNRNELQGAISPDAVLTDSPNYDSIREPAIARFHDARPQAVTLCRTPADVSETIVFERRYGLRTATRSGGHCIAGCSSTEGIVIYVTPIRSVWISGNVATVGAAAGRTFSETNDNSVAVLLTYSTATSCSLATPR